VPAVSRTISPMYYF